MRTLRTIDAHGGGAALRVIVDGVPAPRGRTMAEKLIWARRHVDSVRGTLMREPRGHRDMTGAVLTEPVHPGSHAGVLFMHGGGFAPAFFHGLVSLATIALERGLIVPGGDGHRLVIDTVAGTIRAEAAVESGHGNGGGGVRVRSVTCTLPPAFVVKGGATVRAGGRLVPVDLAFAGACLAVVDSEAAGVGLTPRLVPEIRRMGVAILEALAADVPFIHPTESVLKGIHGVVFTGPPESPHADVRAVLTSGHGQIAASPTEAGSSALLALIDAIGLLNHGGRLAIDSLAGATWVARIAARTRVGEFDAIVPDVEGSAWLTGDHTFQIAAGDPLPEGFAL